MNLQQLENYYQSNLIGCLKIIFLASSKCFYLVFFFFRSSDSISRGWQRPLSPGIWRAGGKERKIPLPPSEYQGKDASATREM